MINLFNKAKNKISAEKNLNESKLGVSYSLWDGEELLEFSIKSIRNEVDYINVVWQKLSWHKEECSDKLEEQLNILKEKGLIDEIILFEPDFSKPSSVNETNKRNLGLTFARNAGCTHFMTLDTDEFFFSGEFQIAKNYVIKNGITHSACNQYMYRDINYRDTKVACFFAPFIYNISKNESFVNNCFKDEFWVIDPTKQIPINRNSKIKFLENISMHHYNGVRKDLKKKYRNSSADFNEQEQAEIIKRDFENLEEKILNGEVIDCENYFRINLHP